MTWYSPWRRWLARHSRPDAAPGWSPCADRHSHEVAAPIMPSKPALAIRPVPDPTEIKYCPRASLRVSSSPARHVSRRAICPIKKYLRTTGRFASHRGAYAKRNAAARREADRNGSHLNIRRRSAFGAFSWKNAKKNLRPMDLIHSGGASCWPQSHYPSCRRSWAVQRLCHGCALQVRRERDTSY